MNRGKKVDRALTVGGLSAAVIPEFVWAVVLILVFGVAIQVFPVSAFPDEENPNLISSIYHLILPSIALLFVLFGYISRITRAGVIEALDSDYMRTAVLKGLSRKTAVFKHVLRNALLPTIAVIATQVPYLAGGLIAIERVFNYPGFGNILLDAVIARDFPLLQSAVFLTGVVIIVKKCQVRLTHVCIFEYRICRALGRALRAQVCSCDRLHTIWVEFGCAQNILRKTKPTSYALVREMPNSGS